MGDGDKPRRVREWKNGGNGESQTAAGPTRQRRGGKKKGEEDEAEV